MTIDEFIDIVHPKLKHRVSVSQEQYTGAELMLTGVPTPEGGWRRDGLYTISVPCVEEIDHRANLRMVFITKGKAGVMQYLRPYIDTEDNLKKVMQVL